MKLSTKVAVKETFSYGMRNLTNLTFLNRLALWWLTRELTKHKDFYKSYHATVSMKLADLQRDSPCNGEEPIDMRESASRDYVAARILETLFPR